MNPQENLNSNTTSEEGDADMDAFLDKIKYEYKDGWTEENWEEVLRLVLQILTASNKYFSQIGNGETSIFHDQSA